MLTGGILADEIDTGGGADVVHADEGNDIVTIHGNGPWTIDGGDGVDTIRLSGAFSLDGSQGAQNAASIEVFDLNKTAANTIVIDPEGLNQINAEHVLRITGNGDDTVVLAHDYPGHPNGQWVSVDTNVSYDLDSEGDHVTAGVLFDTYEYRDGVNTLATLYVQHGVHIDAVPAIAGDLTVLGVKGSSILLTPADFRAVNSLTAADQQTFTVQHISHGHLFNSGLGEDILTFTQDDLDHNLIRFVTDNSTYVGQASLSSRCPTVSRAGGDDGRRDDRRWRFPGADRKRL